MIIGSPSFNGAAQVVRLFTRRRIAKPDVRWFCDAHADARLSGGQHRYPADRTSSSALRRAEGRRRGSIPRRPSEVLRRVVAASWNLVAAEGRLAGAGSTLRPVAVPILAVGPLRRIFIVAK